MELRIRDVAVFPDDIDHLANLRREDLVRRAPATVGQGRLVIWHPGLAMLVNVDKIWAAGDVFVPRIVVERPFRGSGEVAAVPDPLLGDFDPQGSSRGSREVTSRCQRLERIFKPIIHCLWERQAILRGRFEGSLRRGDHIAVVRRHTNLGGVRVSRALSKRRTCSSGATLPLTWCVTMR